MERKMILVVEDEPISAMDFCDQLRENGFSVDGPYPDNESALAAIDRKVPDAALLDFSLQGGVTTETTATRLSELQVPFVFLTGCLDTSISPLTERFGVDLVPKPVGGNTLSLVTDALLPPKRFEVNRPAK